jgi:hypothetical protein
VGQEPIPKSTAVPHVVDMARGAASPVGRQAAAPIRVATGSGSMHVIAWPDAAGGRHGGRRFDELAVINQCEVAVEVCWQQLAVQPYYCTSSPIGDTAFACGWRAAARAQVAPASQQAGRRQGFDLALLSSCLDAASQDHASVTMVKPLQRRRRQLQQFWGAQQTNPELAEQAELRLLDMEAKQAEAAEAVEQQAVEREAARQAAAPRARSAGRRARDGGDTTQNASMASRRSTVAPSTPPSAQTPQATAWRFSSLPVLPGLPSSAAPNTSYVLDCVGSRWRCLLGVSA